MNFKLEERKRSENREAFDEKRHDNHLKIQEVPENYDHCSLDRSENKEARTAASETSENTEKDFEDCEARHNEGQKSHLEQAYDETDSFDDCGIKMEGSYVAEVTYLIDSDISEEEAESKIQETYSETDDPKNMDELKEKANENEHIYVVEAELVESPEISEIYVGEPESPHEMAAEHQEANEGQNENTEESRSTAPEERVEPNALGPVGLAEVSKTTGSEWNEFEKTEEYELDKQEKIEKDFAEGSRARDISESLEKAENQEEKIEENEKEERLGNTDPEEVTPFRFNEQEPEGGKGHSVEHVNLAFEKENLGNSEVEALKENNQTLLKETREKLCAVDAELSQKFEEVLSMERGTDDYRNALKNYNSLKNKRELLNYKVIFLTAKQQMLEEKASEREEDGEELSGPVNPDLNQVTSVVEYMSAHAYTREDFSTYSQDPQWRRLMREEFPDYELPPIKPEIAKARLSEYMNAHNYGKKDFEKYSKDPEWQELRKYAYLEFQRPKEIELSEINNFEDLAGYLELKYSLKLDDAVKQLDITAVTESFSGVESVIENYPDVGILLKSGITSDTGIMSCTGSTLTFNPQYFEKRETLQSTCGEMSARGFWVKKSSPSSIGVHEAAHGVEWALICANTGYRSEAERVHAWNQCTEAHKIVWQACKTIRESEFGRNKSISDLVRSISKYAMKDDSETMAEAFADVYANGKNASPVSLEIVRLAKIQMDRYKGV